MKALVLEAEWSPKKDYKISDFEAKTGKAICGNAIWRNPKLVIKDIPEPSFGADDVLIKVKRCGVCGSDMHFYETDEQGYIMYPGLTKFPCVLGHEFSGEIVETGKNVRDLKSGDKVTVEEMIWCGVCKPCRAGLPNHCANLEELGFTIQGAFAEYIAVHSKYCWKIDALAEVYLDEDLLFEAGATVEPTSVSYNCIFIRGQGIKPGAYSAVFGAGPIGLTAISLLKKAGSAKVIAFEISKTRRELAKKMGADYVFDPISLYKDKTSPSEVIMELTAGEGADFLLEAAGAPQETIPEMEKALAIGGKIVQVGRAAQRVPMYLEVFQVRRGQVFGSQGHSGHNIFPNVIRLMASGIIDNTPMITARFPLDKAVDAIAQSTSREDGKIMVKVG